QVDADLTHLKELVQKTNPEVMSDGEIEDIKAAKEKLMNSAQQLFSKMYEQAQAANGGAGPDMSGFQGGNSNGGGNDDNVVDGDYREI
ncbi:MAG: molecular chaperone DnaK, partial [Lachnospiraceae bacterium]|nr:molecular chaperone DnaK [Lachnospiraceae bacterium]